MHKNPSFPSTPNPSFIKTSTKSNTSNNVEQLVHRLVLKIASVNNLNDKLKEEFVNKKYAYIVKLFCSDAFAGVFDAFEVSEKIKKV